MSVSLLLFSDQKQQCVILSQTFVVPSGSAAKRKQNLSSSFGKYGFNLRICSHSESEWFMWARLKINSTACVYYREEIGEATMAHCDLFNKGAQSSGGFTSSADQMAALCQRICRQSARDRISNGPHLLERTKKLYSAGTPGIWSWKPLLQKPLMGEPEPYGMWRMPFYVRRPFVLEQETI